MSNLPKGNDQLANMKVEELVQLMKEKWTAPYQGVL